MLWTRRVFVQVGAVAAGAAVLGWSQREALSKLLDPPRAPENLLSAEELNEIVAVADTLFEPDDEQERGELEKTMRWWAEGRVTRGPHLDVYKAGLAALATTLTDRRESLAALGPADRKALITPLVAGEEKGPFKVLTDEILEGIYSSAIGWRSLGYTTFPGVPSGPLEYTTRPHGPARVVATA